MSLALAVLAVPPARAGASSADRKAAGMISVGMYILPADLDPTTAWNFQHFLLIQSVYQPLIRVLENGNLVGDLAPRWTIDDGGKTYTFHLDGKATFHDGRPVTAGDAAWSLSRHFWAGSESVTRSLLGQALGVKEIARGALLPQLKVLDARTLRLTLPHPYPPILSVLAMPAFGVIPRDTRSFSAPIGSGPMMAGYAPERRVWTFRVFPGYGGPRPKIRGMTVRLIADMTDAKNALSRGEVDVIVGQPWGELEGAKLPEGFRVIKTGSMAFLHLFLNMDNPLFADQGFRRDLASLIQTPFRSEIFTPFHEFQPHYLPFGMLPRDYYLSRAAAMSPEAFRLKWSSRLLRAPLRVVLRKNAFSARMVSVLRSTLESGGMRLDLSEPPAEQHIKILRAGTYDIVSGGYLGTFPDPDGFLDPLREDSRARMGRAPTAPFLEEVARSRFLPDDQARLAAYAKAFQALEERAFFVPLFQVHLPVIVDGDLSVPDTTYRYESEHWKFYWKTQ